LFAFMNLGQGSWCRSGGPPAKERTAIKQSRASNHAYTTSLDSEDSVNDRMLPSESCCRSGRSLLYRCRGRLRPSKTNSHQLVSDYIKYGCLSLSICGEIGRKELSIII